MLLESIAVLIGLVGFGWAGWKDLKTTEFPDWLPYSMIVAALGVRAVFSFLQGNYSLLIGSAGIGVLFLGFGLVLYYSKQWGDGDAWLLGALGFLYPDGIGVVTGQQAVFNQAVPFPFILIVNFFFVAFFYIVIYSVVVGLRSRETSTFFKTFRKDLLRVVLITVVFTVVLAIVFNSFSIPMERFMSLYLFPPLLLLLLIFLHYGRFVEQNLFKKKIPVSKLVEGDVPVGEKWRVLSKKEVISLKKKGGSIWIKEGVRFAPVFFLTILFMLVFGNFWTIIAGVLF